MPPHWVRNLDAYAGWVEQELESSGGYLPNSNTLVYKRVEDAAGFLRGLFYQGQRVSFWDDTRLVITMVIDQDLTLSRYSFHFQHGDGRLIWRKDKHPGHRGPHIHRDPSSPNAFRPFPEVDLAEVLEEVREHHAT